LSLATAPPPAIADDMHDGSGLDCGPGRDTVYPGFRIAGSFGYTDDVSSGAPSGFIGVDAGFHKELLMPGLSLGAVVGWYGLGDADIAVGNTTVTADYSLFTAGGRRPTMSCTPKTCSSRDRLAPAPTTSGSARSTTATATDFGPQPGFRGPHPEAQQDHQFRRRDPLSPLPREDNSGNKYLTLMARMTFDFGGYGREGVK
jgi:hypothetical protein